MGRRGGPILPMLVLVPAYLPTTLSCKHSKTSVRTSTTSTRTRRAAVATRAIDLYAVHTYRCRCPPSLCDQALTVGPINLPFTSARCETPAFCWSTCMRHGSQACEKRKAQATSTRIQPLLHLVPQHPPPPPPPPDPNALIVHSLRRAAANSR